MNQELKKVGDKNPYDFDLTTGTYNNTAATIKDVSTGHDINYKKASRILLIQRARQKGFIGEAIARTNQLLKEYPNDQDALVERGRNKIQCGYTKSAFNDFSKAFNIQSKLSKGDPVASANDYIKGFSSGFKEGGYELIRDTTTGLYHAIKDPTGTVYNIGHGMYDLAALAADGQGKQAFEKLLPNTYKLMTNSENLSSAEKGRLYGRSAAELASLYVPGKGMQAGSKFAKAINATKNASKTIRMAQEAKIASNSLKNLGKSGSSKTLVSATAKTVPSSSITNRTTQVAKGAGVAQKKTYQFSDPRLKSSITKPYNQHLSVLAHSFSKHAGRHPSKWGTLKGPMNTWHSQALKQLKDVYNGPGVFKRVMDSNTNLTWIEKRLPDGRGVRLNQDYTFKGFID